MCGINAVIRGTKEDVIRLAAYASPRGYIRSEFDYKDANVIFDWLPITDSDAPRQPFISGKCVAFMNGYISNYRELARDYCIELDTDCDTELLVKFLDRFKGERLNELNGFFAVLWYNGDKWDAFTDRYGIKQLYWYEQGDTIYLSSEVKTILNACDVKLSPFYVQQYKYSLGVINHDTIYKDVRRVRKLPFIMPEKIDIPYDEACKRLSELLDISIQRNRTELNSCVFLSGGIDSGIIAKRMQPQYCFSMDYLDSKYSEIDLIKKNSVGKHLTMICNDSIDNSLELVRQIIDDPKAGSCYTNVALTELAAEFCTVIYSGAGGDEFFGGYPHRLDKNIEQVQQRTKYPGVPYNMTHFEYDLMFLDAVLVTEDSIGGFFTMETRYPLLDNDLVDFALSLPEQYKEKKRILKDISGLHEDVLNAPKRGFSNPHFTNDEWVDFTINYIRKDYGLL